MTEMVSLPPVPLTVTLSAAPSPDAEVDGDLRDAGAGEVADRDVVGAAEGGEVDVLDAR